MTQKMKEFEVVVDGVFLRMGVDMSAVRENLSRVSARDDLIGEAAMADMVAAYAAQIVATNGDGMSAIEAGAALVASVLTAVAHRPFSGPRQGEPIDDERYRGIPQEFDEEEADGVVHVTAP